MRIIINGRSPLDYGRACSDTMIRKFAAVDLPPKGQFHYHQGVFLSGMYQNYILNGDEKYFQYIKQWVDSIIDEGGNISFFDKRQLDDIQPGILLYHLYDKTGDARYRTALDTLVSVIMEFPVNADGGLWHKEFHPNQMWLDGLYMAGPICAEYGSRFDRLECIDMVAKQVLLMRKKTEDVETGLWYHACDDAKKEPWADPVTGRSPEFWGRSIGWVPMAVLNDLQFIPTEHKDYGKLCDVVRNLLTAVCKYQSEEGRWYQVVNKGKEAGNWLENSCSCLFTAAICEAVRRGILPESYLEQAKKGYEAVIHSLEWNGEDMLLGNICIGTGVGDYQFYCERPVCTNDLHGTGAFLLMCASVQRSFY